jgi:hypothetical protein
MKQKFPTLSECRRAIAGVRGKEDKGTPALKNYTVRNARQGGTVSQLTDNRGRVVATWDDSRPPIDPRRLRRAFRQARALAADPKASPSVEVGKYRALFHRPWAKATHGAFEFQTIFSGHLNSVSIRPD